jgi:hypothetical protein
MSEVPSSGGFNLNFGNVGQSGSSVAGAVGDIFAAQGDQLEAQYYGLAAGQASVNAMLEGYQTKIRETQSQRQVFQTISAQQAGYAGGNIAESGSAMDVLRSSAQQGAMQNAIISEQGIQQQAAYSEQALSYQSMAKVAENAATGDWISAGIRGATAIAALL